MRAIWQKVMETHKCPAQRARPHATHDQTRRPAKFGRARYGDNACAA